MPRVSTEGQISETAEVPGNRRLTGAIRVARRILGSPVNTGVAGVDLDASRPKVTPGKRVPHYQVAPRYGYDERGARGDDVVRWT